MDNFGDFGLTTSKPLRKRRSNSNRRPLNESESPQEYRDSISLSSTPSDHVSDAPSEGNILHETINWQKGLDSTQCISTAPYTNLADAETMQQSCDEHGTFEGSIDLKRSVEDNPAAASWKMNHSKMSEIVIAGQPRTVSCGIGTGNKFSKVKLKVGGVTHTIHKGSSSGGSSIAEISTTKSITSDAINLPQTLSCQVDQKGGLRGVPWRDFSKTGFNFRKVVDTAEESVKQAMKHGRSSKSTSKKYLSDEMYDEEDDDNEIRYLQKLKTSRIASYDSTEHEDETRGKRLRKISKLMDGTIREHASGIGEYDSPRSVKAKKKSRSVRAYQDSDYMEDEESVSDGEIKHKNKKQRKEPIDVSEYSNESSITTRQRAILISIDISQGVGANLIQFPGGLPPAPPRKPKEQLSEVEQQLKRAEAAQRRKIQNEKAARESEAEAIRKILGQHSSRKRREEKIKKRQELSQERTANAATVASNVVRWVMGPSGTVVTFPDEIGLPSVLESKPCCYPPPREKCAGPSCTNVYKYRDSKSNLPLCSLGCYKAIHDKAQLLPAC